MDRLPSLGPFSHLLAAAIPLLVSGAALIALVRVTDGASPTEVSSLLLRAVGGAAVSALVIVSIVVVARNLRPPRPSWLSPTAGRWRGLVAGALVWLLPAALAFVVLGLLGAPLTLQADIGRVLAVASLVLLAVLLSEAVPEELLFRGWLTDVLGDRLQPVWTIAIQAAIFTGCALLLRGWTGTLDASLFVGMGVGLGYLRYVTQNVWTSIGFHLSFQTGSQLVLTHEVIGFAGSTLQGAVALGMVPFGVGCALVAVVAPARPALFRAA